MGELPPLPYDRTGLEPHISGETLDYHHGKHHAAYVNKLNELCEKDSTIRTKSLEELCQTATGIVYNQACQIWNHSFYWKCMRPNPDSKDNKPHGKIAELIDRDFGSYEN